MSEKLRHAPFYIMLVGVLCISFGFNCVQYHRLEIAKQEKIIYKIYVECLYQKIEKLLQTKTKDGKLNYKIHGGEMYRLDKGDYTSK